MHARSRLTPFASGCPLGPGPLLAGLLILLLFGFAPIGSLAGDETPPSALDAEGSGPDSRADDADWVSQVQQEIQAQEYHVTWQAAVDLRGTDDGWQAPNRAHGLRTYFTERGIRIVPRTGAEPAWELVVSFLGHGRGGDSRAAEDAALSADENRIDLLRSGLVEWYVNDRRGLEQGFVLDGAPVRQHGDDTDGKPVFLDLAVAGSLVPIVSRDGRSVDFAAAGSPVSVLHYGGLHVFDADGRTLPAWMEASEPGRPYGIRILFDDTDAVYPVTVDPMFRAPAWIVEGSSGEPQLGFAVASAGDVNGDDFDDVIIGAPFYDGGQTDEGTALLYHGSAGGLELSPAWTAESDQASAQFGGSVASAGDVNGDGYDDVIIGAPSYDGGQTDEGRAFVYLGSAGGLELSDPWTAESDQADAQFGLSVNSAGDVNGDGYDEVIVGAALYDNGETDEGRAYVYFGSDTGLSTATPWTAESDQANAQFGGSVATAGDVNGDGYDEVIVGAALYDNGETDEGRAYVYLGSGTGLSATAAWTADSDQADAHFGFSVASAGDVNGNGYDEVIVGAPDYDGRCTQKQPGCPLNCCAWDMGVVDTGRVFVHYGSSSGLAADPTWNTGHRESGNLFGSWVSSAGDVDGDGADDVLIGAPGYDGDGVDTGRVYLYQGGYPASSWPAGLRGVGDGCCWDWTVWGDQSSTSFGRCAASAGDVNGDGFQDIIIGAPGYDNGLTDQGRALVFHGNLQVNSATDLVQSLGFDTSDIDHCFYIGGSAGMQVWDQGSDAVSYGPYPGSVIVSTGRGADMGLGNTDFGEDGAGDSTRFHFTLKVPPGALSIRFTTQFITSEYAAGRPGHDRVSLTFGDYSYPWTSVDLDQTTGLTSGEVNPPISHGLNVEDTWLGVISLDFFVYDWSTGSSNDGDHDSALIVSNVFFSDVPLPPDVPGIDADSDGDIDYARASTPRDVSLTEGTYTFAKELISVPGVSMPFRLSMLYNSESVQDGGLGRKWTHSYESYAQKLISDPDGDGVPESIDGLIVRHGSGAGEYFVPDGGGGWTPRFPGVESSLTEELDGTFTLLTRSQLTYRFTVPDLNPNVHLLETVTDTNDNQFRLIYDVAKRVEQVEDTRGETFAFHYDGSGRLTSVDYPAGGTPAPQVGFVYDAVTEDLSTVTDLNGNATDFTYDDNGYLLSVVDATGETLSANTYEEYQGLGVDQTGARLVRLANAGDTALRAPGGVMLAYQGDSMVRTDRLDRVETQRYDVKGRVYERQDPTGATWTYGYDVNDNVSSVTDPHSTLMTLAWDGSGNLESQTAAAGICAGGGNAGNSCSVDGDCPGGRCGETEVMTYDTRNNLLSRTDPLGYTTDYAYDGDDNLLSLADPLGNVSSHSYTVRGQVASTTDPNGNATTFAYTTAGYLESATDPLDGVTTHTYDAMGLRTATTDPEGGTTSFQYDAAGRLTSREDPLGNVTLYVPNPLGRLSSTTGPLGATYSYTYTPTGSLQQITDPLGRSVSYAHDAEDRMVALTDELSQVTTFAHDDADRLTETVDPLGGTTHATYDAVGNRLSLRSPNLDVTTYEYDRQGRRTLESDPLGNSIVTTYDPRSLPETMTNARGQTVSFGYDEAARLVSVAVPGDTVSHVLDANGNRTSSMSGGYGDVTRDFDELSRLLTRTDDFGNTIGHEYDAAGNLTALTYSDGSRVIYAYDDANRLVQVTDWDANVTSYTYDDAGDLTTAGLPDGSTVSHTYDAARRLVARSDIPPAGPPVHQVSYTLDARGRRIEANETLPLDPVVLPAEHDFVYDAANRLVSRGADTYAYDADGNMTNGMVGGASLSMAYDPLNQPVQVGAETFRYDADGLRIEATRTAGTTRYVYSPAVDRPRLLEEHDEYGNVVARYVYGLELISRQAAGTLRVYHYDGSGNAVALTDSSGSVTDRYAYDAYGLIVASEGDTENPFTLGARDGVVDDGNGLYFMRRRFYAPELRRFVQKDPVAPANLMHTQSLNRYAYALGNPIHLADPDGEVAQVLLGAAIGPGDGVGSVLAYDRFFDGSSGLAVDPLVYLAGGALGGGADRPTRGVLASVRGNGRDSGYDADVLRTAVVSAIDWYADTGLVIEELLGRSAGDPLVQALQRTGADAGAGSDVRPSTVSIAASSASSEAASSATATATDVWNGTSDVVSDVDNTVRDAERDTWELTCATCVFLYVR